jgi:aminoglycoside phosphotransferase (APT) family kinase protein
MAPFLQENDEGWDFKVLILEDAWVLRTPRNAEAAENLAKEVRLLPSLASALPVEVPQFEQISRNPDFVVYRLIRGEPLSGEAPDGARAFLDALHSFDVGAIDVPRPEWRDIYREHAEKWRRVVLPLLDGSERTTAEALLSEIETLTGFEPALVHCDLGPSHLLCRDGKLVGVIDWADAKLGDPAIDYAWLLNVPFSDWDVDDELLRRARVYRRLGPWHEVEYGLRTEQPEFVESGLAGVRSRL